jgi:hypothetical protein
MLNDVYPVDQQKESTVRGLLTHATNSLRMCYAAMDVLEDQIEGGKPRAVNAVKTADAPLPLPSVTERAKEILDGINALRNRINRLVELV